MSGYTEVAEPILNAPFEKPTRYWYIREGEQPEQRPSLPEHPKRRPALIFPPKDQRDTWTVDGTILRRTKDFPSSSCCQPFHGPRDVVRQRGWTAASFNATSQVSTGILHCSLFTRDLPVVSFDSDGSALTPVKGGPSELPKGVSSQRCFAQMVSGPPRLHSLEGLQTIRRILP